MGPGTLVCPWDSDRRSAAAVVGAAQRLPSVLARSAGLDEAVRRAHQVLAVGHQGPVHVLSSTWAVPLAWYALVDPGGVQVVAEDGLRRPVWRAPVDDVRARGGRVLRTCTEHLGEVAPVLALAAAVHQVVGQLERGEGHLVAATLAPVTSFWARVRAAEHAS